MKRELSGVLTKTGQGFILYNHKGEVNLTETLKTFWELAEPVHIRIELNADMTIMDERDCEIYLDRDMDRKYKYHINDRNIEDLLECGIYQQVNVLIETKNGRKDYNYGTARHGES